MAASLPQPVRKAIGDFDGGLQAKLAELYGKIQFNEDHLDSFQINSGSLTLDLVPTFQTYLEKELKTAPLGPGGTRASGNRVNQSSLPFLKRPRTQASLPSGLGAALGISSSKQAVEAVTPDPKRLKDARSGDDPAQAITPEPTQQRKGRQVSVKSSVNDKLDATAAGAGAAPGEKARIELHGDRSLWTGKRQGAYAWMDESIEDRSSARDAKLLDAEDGLVAALKERRPELKDAVLGRIGQASQAEVILVGRIVCESLEGKLNDRSMLLEGSRGDGRMARVQLNVACCPEIAAFPGQFVAVVGRSGTANSTFHATDFIPGFQLPRAPRIAAPGCTRLLHTLVLAGPFCRSDGLDYSPLEDALDHAARAMPQVVLLLGPFVDEKNSGIENGEPRIPGRGGVEGEECSVEEVYTRHVLPLLRRGMARLRAASPATEVLLVPSLKEVLSFHPLPQPPLDASLAPALGDLGTEQLKRLGVRFLPNPAHLTIEGLRLTVTSADALSPVLRSGLVLRPEERRIERALRLLLQQRSLFPVFPREPANISETRASALNFPDGELPDVVVFPSEMGKASAQFVDGRLFVNPGTVCRPLAMGSFAEVWLTPPPAAASQAAPDAAVEGAALLQRARVDIKTFSD